jgi:protein CpxP
MKFNKLSLIAGVIALSLTVTPFAANAQNTTSLSTIIAQEIEQGVFKKLNLTDAQKTKIKQILENTQAEINKMLTPKQQQQLNTAIQNREGRGRWSMFASLNLNEQQKTQLWQIWQSTKTRIEGVLTDN